MPVDDYGNKDGKRRRIVGGKEIKLIQQIIDKNSLNLNEMERKFELDILDYIFTLDLSESFLNICSDHSISSKEKSILYMNLRKYYFSDRRNEAFIFLNRYLEEKKGLLAEAKNFVIKLSEDEKQFIPIERTGGKGFILVEVLS